MSYTELFNEVNLQEWIELPDGWLQGRTLFGGLAAGVLIQKAISIINDQSKDLLSCSLTFVGPVHSGKARLTSEVLRQGSSVTSLEVRLWQDDHVQTILLASFGTKRESTISVSQKPKAPDYAQPDTLVSVPFIEGITPECYQYFELCWAEGQYPMMGAAIPDFGGWSRFTTIKSEPNRKMSVADFVVLADIWPPGVLAMLKQPAPASSLTWQITFVQPIQAQLYDWFKYKVKTEYAENGYATEKAYIWNEENELLAICRQTVTVFA